VIRVAPTPLYNTFTDVYDLVAALKMALTGETMHLSGGEGGEANKGH
jgi:kynureninase